MFCVVLMKNASVDGDKRATKQRELLDFLDDDDDEWMMMMMRIFCAS